MRISPTSQQDLARTLQSASARSDKIHSVDLSQLSRVLDYTPEDMTATVEAGISLANFQATLQHHHQWLPVDPPGDEISIRDLLDYNLSGPRRLGYGTVRDYLIGMKVALPNGDLVKAGGKVVKNVAGYDLCKLFVGSRQTLGVFVEATFKLRPIPEKEVVLEISAKSFDQLAQLRTHLHQLPLNPVLLDLYRPADGAHILCLLAFAGAREDVDYQCERVRPLGFTQSTQLNSAQQFWKESSSAKTISVLPSETINTLRKISGPFLCRWANGIIYHRSELSVPAPGTPEFLVKKVKSLFDPNRILPDFAA